MGLKDALDKIVGDVKDGVNEITHRSTADAEQAKRDVAGDDMTLGEKAGSMFNQAKESTQADVSQAKRETRDTV